MSLITASASSIGLDRVMQWNLQYVKVLFLTLLKVVGARGIEPLQAAKEEHLESDNLCGFLYRKSLLPVATPFGAGPLLALGIAHSRAPWIGLTWEG